MDHLKYFDEINETSATGGLACGGMGAVVSAQPSSLAGSIIGTNWSSGGGTTGSGDISAPYNTGTGNANVFQKIPAMGSNHGGRTGKKTRKKRFTIKNIQQLRNSLAQKQDYTKSSGDKSRKVMDFNDFNKDNINKIKK